MDESREEIAFKAGPSGVEVAGKGLQLNSWMTFITLILVIAIATGGFFMVRSMEKMGSDLVTILREHNESTANSASAQLREQKEATIAVRKQTCLNQYEIKDRVSQERFCEAMSR